MRDMTRIGVLTLQGDYEAHFTSLEQLGVEAVPVRTPDALAHLHGLILPGGESTALLKLMERGHFLDALQRFHEQGGAIFGTCAGVILLARDVAGTPQRSLGLLDVVVERNSYGRQRDSFAVPLTVSGLNGQPVDSVFIRAPRIVQIGPGVTVLARYNDDPVLVQEGRVLGATFHPELTGDSRILQLFLDHTRPGVRSSPQD